MTVDLPLLQWAIVHVSLLSCWSWFPGSAPAHMGDICTIILPVCSYLLLHTFLPLLSLSLSMTFLHSSPADLGVLSVPQFSPPHTTSCSLPPAPLLTTTCPSFPPLTDCFFPPCPLVLPPGSLCSPLSTPLLAVSLFALCSCTYSAF